MRNQSTATEPSRVLDADQLLTFRTKICASLSKSGACENPYDCIYTHCRTWPRRNPSVFSYSASLCPNLKFSKDNGGKMAMSACKCDRGRFCGYAHTMEEQMYHPSIYKTTACRVFPKCRKKYCPFAHGPEELREKPSASCPAKPFAKEPSKRCEGLLAAIGKSRRPGEEPDSSRLPPSIARRRARIGAAGPQAPEETPAHCTILPPPSTSATLSPTKTSAPGLSQPTSTSMFLHFPTLSTATVDLASDSSGFPRPWLGRGPLKTESLVVPSAPPEPSFDPSTLLWPQLLSAPAIPLGHASLIHPGLLSAPSAPAPSFFMAPPPPGSAYPIDANAQTPFLPGPPLVPLSYIPFYAKDANAPPPGLDAPAKGHMASSLPPAPPPGPSDLVPGGASAMSMAPIREE